MRKAIEFAPQVGDFVGLGEPLFVLYGGAGVIDKRKLEASVVFGPERTVEQDPLFAFAFSSISRSRRCRRRSMIRRPLCWPSISFTGFCEAQEAEISGPIRFLIGLGNFAWSFGRQIGRILFIWLSAKSAFMGGEHPDRTPVARDDCKPCGHTTAQRHPALHQELYLLDRMIEKLYMLPEDLALARIPDSQGLGASSASKALAWRNAI